jgi:ATP-dependent Clp protease adaptor protein ClpS
MDSTIERSLARAEWRKSRQKSWANVAALIAERTARLLPVARAGRSCRLFELSAPYVSLFTMSCGPWQDTGCQAQIKANEGIIHISNEKAETIITAEPTIEQETRSEDELDVPWQVVVHNDPVNLMSYVTMVFQRVFGFPREKAERHMLEVHQKGRSILWSGMRERAELYVQQLHGYLLLATLEKTC